MDVTLRELDDADLDVLFANQRDPISNQMAGFPARDRDAHRAHYAKIRADPANVLRTIVVDGAVVGDIGSWESEGVREVGYWIGRAHWGRGVATAALRAFVTQIPTRPLYAHVVAHNAGSLRVLAKCGFREHATADGELIMILM
ncbi:MAG: GNAT family N-acetyltransferase [Micromonosporaceae bacterium]